MKFLSLAGLTHFYTTYIKPIRTSLDGKMDKSKIINNLVTTVAGNALDARQGKVLKDALDSINSNLEANSYEDLTHLLSTGYGWTVDRLKCIRQGRLIHLSFFCYASSWTDNKRYIVLNPASGFAEYTPNYITYAVALAYNGDGTGAEPALFDVTDDGHVEICTSSTNRKYYACNMTWTF